MRTFDPSIHNIIANHPAVFPHLGCTREDFTNTGGFVLFDGIASDIDNYVLLHNDDQDAASIFEWSAPDTWEMHTMFLPSCRGKRAIQEGKRLIHEMFVEHGALCIWGRTPLDNKAAKLFNRWVGAQHYGYRHHWKLGECELFRNFKATWLRQHWTE